MLWGVPVLVLLLPVGGAVAWGLTWGRESVETHYERPSRKPARRKTIDRCEFFERKLVATGRRNARHGLQVGARAGGARQSSTRRSSGCSCWRRRNRAGLSAGAQLDLLTVCSAAQLEVPDDERLANGGVHLDHLEKLGVGGRDMILLRAIWLAQSGRLDEASELLEPHVSSMPDGGDATDGDRPEARAAGRRPHRRPRGPHAHEAGAAAQREGKPTRWAVPASWAQAEQLVGDAADFARVLREWLAIDPDNPDGPAGRGGGRPGGIRGDPAVAASRRRRAGRAVGRMLALDREPDGAGAAGGAIVSAAASSRRRWRRCSIGSIASDQTPLPLVAAIGTAAALDGEIVTLARTLLERVVAADADQRGGVEQLRVGAVAGSGQGPRRRVGGRQPGVGTDARRISLPRDARPDPRRRSAAGKRRSTIWNSR